MALTTDSSTNNFQLTAFGDTLVVAGSGNPPFGGGSAYFDGTGDYLKGNAVINYGANFTIEGWVYRTGPGSGGDITIFQAGNIQGGVGGIHIGILSVGGWYFNDAQAGAISGGSAPLNQWVHFAAVRNNGINTLYVNGVSVGTSSQTFPVTNSNFTIGSAPNYNYYFEGYIDDFRITSGIARYTANFTPPTQQLFDPSDPNGNNVSLLLHMDNLSGSQTFIDSSTNNFTLSAFGNTIISSSTKKFGNGSAYFDGTGDYLQLVGNNSLDFGTGDFTVEAWVNPSSLVSDHFIINSVDVNGLFFGWQNNTDIGWGRCGVAWDYSTASGMSTGTWYHAALTRSGSDMRIFVNGQQVGTTQTNSLSYNLNVNGTSIANQTGYYFNGYIDELRITKGVARYTSNFVPHTAPFVNPLPIPSGYLAFWKLDNTTDSSANNNNLTNTGSVQFVAGKIGNCAQFNGSNSLDITSFTPIFNTSQDFSISFWANPTSNVLGTTVGSGGFNIHNDSSGTLNFNNAVAGDCNVPGAFTVGTWKHYVCIKAGGRTKAYINNVEAYNQPTAPAYTATTNSFSIGSFPGGQLPFQGYIDAVGVWQRELTLSEISKLYNSGNGAEP